MKRILLLMLLSWVTLGYSQTFPKSCLVTSLRDTTKLKLGVPIIGMTTKATFSEVILPAAYFKIQQDSAGHYILGQSLTIGVGYVLGSANATINLNSITLSETFYYGVCSYFSSSFGINPTQSFSGGIIGGFNQFSLLLGRNFTDNQWDTAIAYSFSGLPFLNSTAKIRIQ